MANLISLDRALQQIPGARDCDKVVIANLVPACSTVVETFCRRTFAQATYDELKSFQSFTPYLFVNNPPIARVDWVRCGLMPAIYIQCNDTANQVQQATVDVTTTSVVLIKVYNNVTTTSTFTFALYPTFTDLGTAINALGSGWVATVPNQFALWQTSDLTSSAGSFNTRNASCPLCVYWNYLGGYKVNEGLGEIYYGGGFVPGTQTYRVKYQGGYATIPQEIQQATAELVQAAFNSISVNPLMTSETLDKYSYTRAATNSLDTLSVASKLALNQYRIMGVARNRQ